MTLRAEDYLTAMEHLPLKSIAQFDLTGLVVVAPHPDDESLGCGGLIAAARAQDVPVAIVVVSDGVGSHPHSPSYPPERLRALRKAEAVAAAGELGVPADAVHFLRLPDRFVPVSGPEADAAIAQIAAIAEACGANLMTVTWQHDPHCDHTAAFALARAAAVRQPGLRLLAYPVWGFTLPPDFALNEASPAGFRLAVADHLPAKRRAIAAHRSQVSPLIADDPDGFMLTPQDLARFERPHEIYLEVAL